MQELAKLCALALVSVLLIRLLKEKQGEFALLMTLCVIALMGIFLVGLLKPILHFLSEIGALSGLNSELLEATFKVIGIGLLTQLSATACSDAGENAVAKTVELCGSALALSAALPLMEAVLELLRTMGGG